MSYKLMLFFILLLSQILWAQITITANDILALNGQTQIIEADTSGAVIVNVGQEGAGRSWDFRDLPVQIEYLTQYMDPEESPYSGSFPQANLLALYDFSNGDTLQKTYNYFNITQNAFAFLGIVVDVRIPGEEEYQYEEADDEITPLPLIYGAEWSYYSADTLDEGEGIFSIDTYSSAYKIDAWGTVILPSGSYECLRLKENLVQTYTVFFNEFVILADTTSSINYEWISKDVLIVASIESQDGETDPNFSNAYSFSRLKSKTTALYDEASPAVISDFILEQNYPNPFNPSTTISYQLGQAGNVDLSIYDHTGRIIQTLVNGYQNAGRHTVQWNTEGFASGIYYYKIQTPNFKAIKKATLLR